MDEIARKAAGQRGKVAEAAVKKFLVGLKERKLAFDFERKYDARSAGGRFQSQAGDFGFFSPSEHGLIEVKEVAHEYRLPKKNFGADQRARLKIRELAGGVVVILVYHLPLKRWRVLPLSAFYVEEPSWDLSKYPDYANVSEALEAFSYDGRHPFQ